MAAATKAEYARALQALLPQGDAWQANGTPLGGLLDAWAAELARLDARCIALLRETDPGAAVELLADWERVLGLPDPCLTEPITDAQRRLAARSRFTMQGGQSAAFFIALAAQLGYEVTVEDFPTEAAAIAAGISYTGDGWAYTWRVNVASASAVRYFRAGASTAGDRLREWGNEQLECLIERYSPAHTTVLFAYEV
ncbi:MAG: DUF2313 domain-containing protein [Burkholderiales bacterium]|nr:DUF2313 domain-containing protein [Burkholderiales bacterium]